MPEPTVEPVSPEEALAKIREQVGVPDQPGWLEDVLDHIAELQARVYLRGPGRPAS